MKSLKTYNSFVNESVRDAMKPKPEEEVRKILDDMSPDERLYTGRKHDLLDDEEITDLIMARESEAVGDKKYAVIGKWVEEDGTKDWDLLSHSGPVTRDEAEKIRMEAYQKWEENAKELGKDMKHEELVITWKKFLEMSVKDQVGKKTNESVRDMMQPKSDEEIEDAFDDICNDIADILVVMDDEEFNDWNNAYDWAQNHKEVIMKQIEIDPDYNLEKIINNILMGSNGDDMHDTLWHNENESVRNMMKPKSEEEKVNIIEDRLTNVKDENRPMANLLLACENGVESIAKKAIEQGVDVNYKNGVFLQAAAFHGHIEIVKLLLDEGADPSLEDYYAYRLAKYKGSDEICELIKPKN